MVSRNSGTGTDLIATILLLLPERQPGLRAADINRLVGPYGKRAVPAALAAMTTQHLAVWNWVGRPAFKRYIITEQGKRQREESERSALRLRTHREQ